MTSKYGQNRSGKQKVTVITGLPGTGKSHLLKNKIIPDLVKKKKKVLVIDPNKEYIPSGEFVRVYHFKNYSEAEQEFEKLLEYYMKNPKNPRPDVIIIDESTNVLHHTRLLPYTLKLVNTLRHEGIDLILVGRRPATINVMCSEIAAERFIFETHGVNDLKRLNEMIAGLGDQVDQLRDHAYIHVTNDNKVEVIRPARSTRT